MQQKANSFLSAKDLDTLINALEGLLTSLTVPVAKDELGVELPGDRDLPGFGNLLVDDRVVVLEVGTETLGLEGGPEEELLDGVGLVGPDGEAVGVDGELVGKFVNHGGVVEEKDGSGGGLEAGDTAGGGFPASLGDNGLEGVGGDVPELVVLVTEEDEKTVGLGVEGGWGVEGGLADDLLDTLLGDGEFLAEGVVGAAVLGQLDEGVGGELGSHFG